MMTSYYERTTLRAPGDYPGGSVSKMRFFDSRITQLAALQSALGATITTIFSEIFRPESIGHSHYARIYRANIVEVNKQTARTVTKGDGFCK